MRRDENDVSLNSPQPEEKTVSVEVQELGDTKNKEPKKPKLKKNGKPRMRGWKKTLLIVGSILLVLAIAFYALYTILANQISGEVTQAGTLPQEVRAVPEYTGKGIVCGIICGIDYDLTEDGTKLDDQIGRTDLILYLMYDTKNNKAFILQIPRDVYVGDDLPTGGTGKVNSLYYAAPDVNNRMAALARMLNDQLRLPTDFYATIDMEALKEIIDIKGSIEVFVPMEVNDPENGIAIEPGWRYFSGAEAEFYLRNRKSTTYKDQGDIMRLQMQQNFYSSLFREFETLAPGDLVMWMRVLLYRCDTDMDPLQLGGLAQKALNLESENITFVRPPVGVAEYNGQSMLYLMPEETASLLNEYFRPEGYTLSLKDLDIQTLPFDDDLGKVPASVRTMSSIRVQEMQTAAQVKQADEAAARVAASESALP